MIGQVGDPVRRLNHFEAFAHRVPRWTSFVDRLPCHSLWARAAFSSVAVSNAGKALKLIATSIEVCESEQATPGIPCSAANSAAAWLWRPSVTRLLKTSIRSIRSVLARRSSASGLMCERRNGSYGCGTETIPCSRIASAVTPPTDRGGWWTR